MMSLRRIFYSLVLALILLNIATGGVVPLWAQQPQVFPWPPIGPGGMSPAPFWPQQPQAGPGQWTWPSGTFSDSTGFTAPGGGPLTPSQVTPGADSRLRPSARQCAAEALWQRTPMAPQPSASPQQVVQVTPQQEIEMPVQQPPSRPRSVRTGRPTTARVESARPSAASRARARSQPSRRWRSKKRSRTV